jgi:hypothetical protein
MTAFDWRQFLDRHGISYSVGSPHGKGYIGVRCPFCGLAGTDPTRHRIGIDPLGRGWRCLRDETHRGKSPVALVAGLIGCTIEEAKRICGIGDAELPPMSLDGIEAAMKEAFNPEAKPEHKPTTLEFPNDIRRIDNPAHREHRVFLRYLETKRRYSHAEAVEIAALYGLRAAMAGPFAYRIIFPVEMASGLVTWTGRAINDGAVLRYKTLSTDPEKCKRERLPVALENIKRCLWNARELEKSEGVLLVGVEGPFDAVRIDYYGRHIGVRATCLFSKTLSKRQALLLSGIGKFKRRAILLDNDAVVDGYMQAIDADFAGLEVIRLPAQVKDPDLLTRDDVSKLLPQYG